MVVPMVTILAALSRLVNGLHDDMSCVLIGGQM